MCDYHHPNFYFYDMKFENFKIQSNYKLITTKNFYKFLHVTCLKGIGCDIWIKLIYKMIIITYRIFIVSLELRLQYFVTETSSGLYLLNIYIVWIATLTLRLSDSLSVIFRGSDISYYEIVSNDRILLSNSHN